MNLNPKELIKFKKLEYKRIARGAITFFAFVLLVFAARSSLADHYFVPSGSMRPSIEIGDRVLVNKLAFGLRVPFTNLYLVDFQGPQHGDVVVCESPEDSELLIKRVVAVPGDRVEIRSGRVWLNGEIMPVRVTGDGLQEMLKAKEHLLYLSFGGGPDYGPVNIPPDMYLIMGDNRGSSKDGRIFGLIQRSAIYGRAVGIFLRESRPIWQPL